MWMERHREGIGAVVRQWSALAAITAAAGAVMLLNLHILLASRVSGSGVRVSFDSWKIRTVEMLIVMAPLGVMTMIALASLRRSRRAEAGMLALLGIGACLMAILVRIPYWDNEYKLVFAAAIALAPLAAMGTERAAAWMGRRWAVAFLAAQAVFLIGPFVHIFSTPEPDPDHRIPKTDIRSFQLRLDPSEPLAHLCDAIRREVPINGILLLNNVERHYHYPTLTGRSVYVTPPTTVSFTGVNQGMDMLLHLVRGYDEKTVADRIRVNLRFHKVHVVSKV